MPFTEHNMKKAITDIQTGVTEMIEMTAEEIAIYEKWKKSEDDAVAEITKKLEEAAAKRQTLLDKLGITEEEAKLLLS